MAVGRYVLLAVGLLSMIHSASAQESKRALYRLDVEKESTQEISPRADLSYGSAVYSADGKRIAFDAWPVGASYGQSRVYVMSVEDQTLIDVAPGAFPSWSPDNQQITYRGEGKKNKGMAIIVVHQNGSGREELPINGNSPRWSPNGRHIAFVGGSGISIYDAARGRTTPLSMPVQNIFWGGCWSPDGTRYCFPASKRSPVPDSLMIIEFRDDMTMHRWSSRYSGPEIGTNMDWSRQTKRIVFFSRAAEADKFQLYVIEAEGNADPVWLSGQDRNRSNTDPAWSPDGKYVVYSSSP